MPVPEMPQSFFGAPDPENAVPYTGAPIGGASADPSYGDEPATRLSQEQQPQGFGDRFGGVSAPREMENTAPVPFFEQSTIDVPRALQNRDIQPQIRSQADFNELDAAADNVPLPVPRPDVEAGFNAIDSAGGTAPSDVASRRAAAIAGIESGGSRDPYTLLGAVTRTGDRAYGKYQVMGKNIPNWTEEALGRRMTPREFLADKEAQDATFQHRFGQYADRYGEEGAARAWYAGEKGMRNLGASDLHGRLTVKTYGEDYVRRAGLPPAGQEPAQQPAQEPAPASRPTALALAPPQGAAPIQGGPGGVGQPVVATGVGEPAGGRDAIAAALIAQGGDPREASQSFTNPTGEVSQQNPTLAGVTPPQLSPIGASRPAASSMILAQAGGGNAPSLFDPRPTARQAADLVGADEPPLGPAVPDPRTIRPAPNAPPSMEPIPQASRQERTPPGPEPERPPLLTPSPQQRYWERVLGDPRASDRTREIAKQQIAVQETYRKEHQAARDNDFINRRTQYQEQTKDYEKWVREAPDRDIDQMIKRLSIQKAQADANRAPAEALKLQLEIDKLHKELTAPHRVSVAGTQFEQPHVGPGQAPQPYRVSPGLPQPEEKPLTEQQAKAAEFVSRTRGDLNDLRIDHGAILANPVEAARGNVPMIGNLVASEAYRKANNASNNWGAAFLTHVSGAAVSPSEAGRNLPAFLPRAGDDAAELERKTRRRDDMTNAIARSSGERGMATIKAEMDRQNEAYMANKPPVRVNSKEEAEQLPVGQRIILPDGRTGVVPPRRR